LALQLSHLALAVVLPLAITLVIEAAAVVVPELLDKIQLPEMVEPEKSLQLLGLTLVAVALVDPGMESVESAEMVAAEMVAMVPVILAVMTQLQTLAAAVEQWEMLGAVIEH
jgi:hypothetical protein